jgi:hypothetical protein
MFPILEKKSKIIILTRGDPLIRYVPESSPEADYQIITLKRYQ